MVDNDLKNLERNLFLKYFEDGFWDMYIGLLMVSFGLTILLDLGYLAGIFSSLGIFIPSIGKSRITYPRMGYIKFRKTKIRNISFILFGVMLLGVVLFFFFAGGRDSQITQFLRKNLLFVIGSVWGGALGLAAAFLNVNRYFIYAGLVFMGVSLAHWIGSLGLNLIMVGVLIIIMGMFILKKFIRNNPIIPAKSE